MCIRDSAGFGLTPLAMATAQIATQAKVPEVVMAAATATITEASPYIVRTSFTLPQASEPMADWATANGIRKVFTVVTDYGPGIDAETSFAKMCIRDRKSTLGSFCAQATGATGGARAAATAAVMRSRRLTKDMREAPHASVFRRQHQTLPFPQHRRRVRRP